MSAWGGALFNSLRFEPSLIPRSKMDIINCELLWIDGCCYRKLTPVNRFSIGDGEGCSNGVYSYEDEPTCLGQKPSTSHPHSDDSSAMGPKGFFRLSLYVPQRFLPRLCGKKHAVRMQMEHDTNTTIKVPPQDKLDDVIITGSSEADVESAHLRISTIMNAFRQHENYTHFICFPLNHPKLGSVLDEFKEIVMKSCTGRGLDGSLFASKHKLHLTIGMLVLLDAREIAAAQRVLDDCEDLIPTILEEAPLVVRVHGLEIMNDDECEVDVLYAKVSSFTKDKDGTPRSADKCKLQMLADEVAKRFIESGFMLRQHERGPSSRGVEHVKLHMTVMNTRLREQRFATENVALAPARKPRNSFDASAILKRNRDINFGKIHVPSINVVDPHDCDADGFYKRVASLSLPKQHSS